MEFGIVYMITLLATFVEQPYNTFYSHHPMAIFMTREICDDTLDHMYDYYYNGSVEYIAEQKPNSELEGLELQCQKYTISPRYGFVPLEHKYTNTEEI